VVRVIQPPRPTSARPDTEHSPEYKDYLASPAWQRRRQQALGRARERCEACGEEGGTLHCHHLTYHNLGNEGAWDLMVLCPACHDDADLIREDDLNSPHERNAWIAQRLVEGTDLSWEESRWYWVLEGLTGYR
jgi:5-methylcytosine-specific restriction endonuclease McrA